MSQFRTPSGQTGHDAYLFEATQIANAKRVLDRRFHALLDTVRAEAPEQFAHASDYRFKPGSESAARFAEYLVTPCSCTQCRRDRNE